MNWPKEKHPFLEEHARCKQPKKGKCSDSDFKNGWHRIGFVPDVCHLDDGLRGMVLRETCLSCGKKFSKSLFMAQ